MIIRTIKIKNFGKFSNFELQLNDEMNIIYGKNEAGKSTLQYFIKCMFYGMNSMKKNLRENERKRFLPWNGDKAEGQLVFEHQGTDYVIERSFSSLKREDTINIYNLLTGEKVNCFDSYSPGKDIFGLGEEAFEKTLFVKQLGAKVARDKEDEIMKKLSNLSETGDEEVSFHKSINILDDSIKALKGGRKQGKIDELQQKISTLNIEKQKIEKSISANIEYSSKLMDIDRQINEYKFHLEELTSKRQITQKLFIYYKYNEIKNEEKKLADINTSISNLQKKFYNGSMEEANYEVMGIKEAALILFERKRDLLEIKSRFENIKMRKDEQLTTFSEYDVFEALDEDVEEKLIQLMHKQHESKEYKEKIMEMDNIKLKYQIQLQKQKMFFFAMLLGIIFIGLSLGSVLFKNFFITLLLFFAGIALCIYGILNYKTSNKILKGINYIENQQISKDVKKIDEEIEKSEKYIGFLLKHCNAHNVDEFYEKLKAFKQIKENILSISFEESSCIMDLKRKEDQIEIVSQDILIMLSNFPSIDSKKYKIEEINWLENTIHSLESNIAEYNRLKSELISCKNRYTNLMNGTDISSLEDQMESIKADMPDILQYYNELAGEDAFSSIEKLDDSIKVMNISLLELEKEKESLENKIMETSEGSRLASIVEEIESCRMQLNDKLKTLDAINIARETLQAAFIEIQKNYAPILNNRVSSIMSKITDNKYEKIYISQGYEVTVKDKMYNKITEIDYLSGGTLDQVYFALRIGIADTIFKKVRVPVILDDAFIQFDDIRLSKTIDFLRQYSTTNQVILFTCQENHKKYFNDAVINI